MSSSKEKRVAALALARQLADAFAPAITPLTSSAELAEMMALIRHPKNANCLDLETYQEIRRAFIERLGLDPLIDFGVFVDDRIRIRKQQSPKHRAEAIARPPMNVLREGAGLEDEHDNAESEITDDSGTLPAWETVSPGRAPAQSDSDTDIGAATDTGTDAG